MNYEFIIDLVPEQYRFGTDIAACRGIDMREALGKELMITDSYQLVVRRGEVDVKLNGELFRRVTAGTMIFCLRSTTIEFLRVSDDFLGHHLFVFRQFFGDLLIQKKPFPNAFISKVHDYHLFELSPKDTELISEGMYRIERDILRKEHLFHREILLSDFTSLLMEMGDIFTRQAMIEAADDVAVIDRKDAIVAQFVELLDRYGAQKQEVSFYAEKLCITPQYLTRLMKEKTGQTVHDHICRVLMINAKLILRKSDVSVQEVAEQLAFSDQASFGKFFKKYAGLSPIAYKKRF